MENTRVDAPDFSFKHELIRKGIHLSSLSIPIIYWYITRELALTILVPLTLAFVLVDTIKFFHEPTRRLYYRTFSFILRRHETEQNKKTFNGATWVLISATFCVWLFPKLIFVTAFSILIISDTASALFGRKFGRRRFKGKSLEGSLAFVLTAWIAILFTPKLLGTPLEYGIAFAAAVVGAIAEVLSYGIIDDNFAIPVSIGGVMWILLYWFYPGIPLY
ncbi:MAG: dolichol kinase [Chlorobi bacterium]|nr:dolichol kinase [Chlorobiota bacterium]